MLAVAAVNGMVDMADAMIVADAEAAASVVVEVVQDVDAVDTDEAIHYLFCTLYLMMSCP